MTSNNNLEKNIDQKDLALAQTECLWDDGACRLPERPVVPGPRDAVTATRHEDLRQALALAPTQLVLAPQAIPSNPYPDTLEDSVFLEGRLCSTLVGPRLRFRCVLDFFQNLMDRLSAIRPRRLIASIAVVAMLLGIILGVGGRLLWSQTALGPGTTIAEKAQPKTAAPNMNAL